MFKDILEALQSWPKWKRVEGAPERIDALEKRMGELEARLARCPGEGCPQCGELEFRVLRSYPHHQLGDMGVIVREMKCERCGFSEPKTIAPK
jgi:hypothetical protein